MRAQRKRIVQSDPKFLGLNNWKSGGAINQDERSEEELVAGRGKISSFWGILSKDDE